ncbi:MAG: hypothetical protein U0871_12760 [Gemmataceae bacterium]
MSADRPADPRRPKPDADPTAGVYGFAEPEPPPLPRPPLPPPEHIPRPAEDLGEELDLDADLAAPPAAGGEPHRRKKRKRRRPDEDAEPAVEDDPGYGPRSGEIGDRILQREETEPPYPWWAVPSVLVGVGMALCLIPVVALAVREGAAAGGVVALAAFGGLVAEVLVLSVLLAVVGALVGIDYGPLPEAVLKLAAVASVVTGLLGAGAAAGPVPGLICGGVLALAVGIGLFQGLFRLAVYETLLTLGGILAVSFGVQFLLFSVLMNARR